MKQPAKKKPKAFRTLVRLAHQGEKPASVNSRTSGDRLEKEKQPGQPPSFFGR